MVVIEDIVCVLISNRNITTKCYKKVLSISILWRILTSRSKNYNEGLFPISIFILNKAFGK